MIFFFLLLLHTSFLSVAVEHFDSIFETSDSSFYLHCNKNVNTVHNCKQMYNWNFVIASSSEGKTMNLLLYFCIMFSVLTACFLLLMQIGVVWRLASHFYVWL